MSQGIDALSNLASSGIKLEEENIKLDRRLKDAKKELRQFDSMGLHQIVLTFDSEGVLQVRVLDASGQVRASHTQKL